MRRLRVTILTLVVAVSLAGLLVGGAAATSINKTQPPSGTVGQSYSFRINADEGSFSNGMTWNVSSGAFPPGLRLSYDGNRWVDIVGTPTTPGLYKFYIQAVDKAPEFSYIKAEEQYTLIVNGAAARLVITTTSLPDAGINQAYTAPALTASGGSVSSWAIVGGALPPGVALAANGVISGTPTQSGTFTFTVQANGPSATADTHQLSIFVAAPLELQSLVGKKPPTAGWSAKTTVNATLTTGVKAVGGRAPYTYSSTGALPPGITLDAATGALTGAASSSGKFASTITVTDATGAKVSVPWSFNILPLIDFAKGKGLPSGKVDRQYSAKFPVTGKEARTAEFAIAGKIPPGLELDETTGRLTGTLLKAGSYRIRVFAFSATGAPISKLFTIRVRA